MSKKNNSNGELPNPHPGREQDHAEPTKPGEARRDAIRKLLAGGGLVGGAWGTGALAKPVIKTVILPAHAGTTDGGSATTTASS